MTSTIIVGYDGRDHATDALALGQLLARTTSSRLAVVCAYPEDPLGHGGAVADMGSAVRHDAEAAIARARALVGDGGGVEVEFHALAGAKPSQVLHDIAEEREALAIVVGATHHGAAVRLLTGSTPERVLDGSPCPVAVAPAGFAAKNADHTTDGVLGGAGGSSLQVAVAYDESPEAAQALAAAADFARRAGGRLRVVTAVNSAVGLYPPLDPTAYAEIADIARRTATERLDAAVGETGRADGRRGRASTATPPPCCSTTPSTTTCSSPAPAARARSAACCSARSRRRCCARRTARS